MINCLLTEQVNIVLSSADFMNRSSIVDRKAS